jgi:ankyrin repeat protein
MADSEPSMSSTVDAATTKAVLRAAKNGDLATVKNILAADPSAMNVVDKEGSTLLHCAAWKGHVELVRLLLDAGAPINATSQNNHYGTTPLHAAAHANNRAVAQMLIERGADLNAKNLGGRTPLGETAIHKATAVATLLREHGAT